MFITGVVSLSTIVPIAVASLIVCPLSTEVSVTVKVSLPS